MLRQQLITKGLAALAATLAVTIGGSAALATLVMHFDPNDTRTTFQGGRQNNPDGTIPALNLGDQVGWIMDTRVPSIPTPDPDNGQDGFIDAQQAGWDNKPIIGYHPIGNVLNYLDSGNNDNLLVFPQQLELTDGYGTAADSNIGTIILAGRADPLGTGNSYLIDFRDDTPIGGGVDALDGFSLRYNHDSGMLEGLVKQSVAGSVAVPAGAWFVATYRWDGPGGMAHLSVDTAAGNASNSAVASAELLTSDRMRFGNTANSNDGLLGQLGDIMFYNDIDDHSAVANQLAADYLSIAELVVNRETGNVSLMVPSSGGAITNVVGYTITSENNALDSANWMSIADNYDADNLGPNQRDPDNQWTELTDSSSIDELAEFEFQGNGGVNAGADFLTSSSTDLGNAWRKYYREDLKIEVALNNDAVFELPVRFTENGGVAYQFGDLDFSGDIDYDDLFDVLKPNYGMDTSALPLGPSRYSLGDMDEDGAITLTDFLLLNEAYLAANPGAAALSWDGAQVPEPATWILLTLGCLALAGRRLGRATRVAGGILLVLVAIAPQYSVAAAILNVDFEHLTPGATIGDGSRIQDTSGNRYHGFWGGGSTLANGTPVQKAYGKVVINNEDNDGYVILRDGLGDGGPEAPNAWWGVDPTPTPYLTLDANTSYTFEAVLNWNGDDRARDGIMGQTGEDEWWIREDNGILQYVFDDGPNRFTRFSEIDISALIDNNDWHHVGITFARDITTPTEVVITTYFDYQQVDQVSAPLLEEIGDGTVDVRLGGYNTTAANRFDGLMAHFRISDEVLSTDQFLPVPIPEPTTWALLLLGCTAVGGRRLVRSVRSVGLAILAMLIIAPQSYATVGGVLDVSFEHLTPGTTVSDGSRIQDYSGNRYHGFWGGGTAANDTPVVSAFPGSTTVVNNEDNQGFVILRDALEDGGPGAPNDWWGVDPTPTPYFSLGANTSYTFEAVLNWNGNDQGNEGIMGFTGDTEWWIRENGGNLEYVFDDGPNRLINTGTIDINSMVDNTDWHHVGITFARDTVTPTTVVITSYLDYQQVHQETAPLLGGISPGTGDLRLGAYNTSATARFDGLMDHFRISDEVLAVNQFLPLPQEPQYVVEVNKTNGIVKIINDTGVDLTMDAYRLTSEAGSLDSSLWTSLESVDYEGQGEDSGWTELGDSANEISEGFLGGSSAVPSPSTISLGQIYTDLGNEDGTLKFEYHIPGNAADVFSEIAIQFVTGTALAGDYNGDGVVNAADYALGRDQFSPGFYPDFVANFGGSSGSGSGQASAVPEPSSMFLFCFFAAASLANRFRAARRLFVLAIGCLAVVASTAHADAFVDRQYTMGDDPFEGGSAGGFPGLTFDSMGVNLTAFPGAINTGAYQDLIVTGAQYVDVGSGGLMRPGAGAGELGMSFDGIGNRLTTVASLNWPNNTWRTEEFFPMGIDALYDPPSATSTDGTGDGEYRPAFPHSYAGIHHRAMQAWVRPDPVGLDGARQDVLLDTEEHGFFITADNTWAFLFDNGTLDTEILVTDTLDSNGWVHLMALGGISKTQGPNSTLGGALLINGVVVASSNAIYDASTAALSIGSNLAGDENFFQGTIDDVEMLLWGENSWRGPGATQQELGYLGGADWGLISAGDNQWIALELEAAAMAASVPSIPDADVNLDGVVAGTGAGPAATDDVSAFVLAYGFENAVGPIPVGDWNSRQNGDLNFDGVADIRDALMLRDALVSAGSGSFDLSLLNGTTVPEPSGIVLAIGFLSALACFGRRQMRFRK